MARTFRFPFPGRKVSAEKQFTTDSQRLDSRGTDDAPTFHPGEKASRILGTSEQNMSESAGKQSRKPNQLWKRPSFMNVSILEEDSSAKDSEETHYSGKLTPGGTLRQPLRILHTKPSSPLLGHHFMNEPRPWGGLTDVSDPQVHHCESSSTLRSYYDPLTSPLAVSQQTSASSARDMALRKGGSPSYDSHKRGGPISASKSAVADENCTSTIAASVKKRPPPIDLSMLFPKPRPSKSMVSLPRTATKQSPRATPGSSSQRPSSGRPKWLGGDGIKSRDSDPNNDRDLQNATCRNGHIAKLNVEKPTKGTKNWFDGLEEEEIKHYVHNPNEVVVHRLPEIHRNALKSGHDQVSRDLRLRQRKSSMSDPRQHTLTSRRALISSPTPPITGSASSPTRESPQLFDGKSTPSFASRKSGRSGESNGTALAGMDLRNESVLSLSSSDDETEQTISSSRVPLRDSIKSTATGDEPICYSAVKVRAIKPKPIVNVPMARTLGPNISQGIPPVPKIPEGPQLYHPVPSPKWRSDVKSKIIAMKADDVGKSFKTGATGPIIDDAMSNESSPIRPHPPTNLLSSALHKEHFTRGSKMMAVTLEEEKLLEAMRKKRASIRHVDFAEGYHQAMQMRGGAEPIPRPKTASVDKGHCFFEPDNTASRPPRDHALKNSITGIPFAASTEDLSSSRSDDCYPFPEEDPSSSSSRRVSSIPPPHASPSLSFSPSDILPSPPSSCFSPKTPPPDLLEVQVRGFAVSPSRPLRLQDPSSRHERKRTISSGVVMLDEVEPTVQDLDSEDEITGWAMNRW